TAAPLRSLPRLLVGGVRPANHARRLGHDHAADIRNSPPTASELPPGPLPQPPELQAIDYPACDTLTQVETDQNTVKAREESMRVQLAGDSAAVTADDAAAGLAAAQRD